VSLTCDSFFRGNLTGFCPFYTKIPQCIASFNNVTHDNLCTVTSFTASAISCECVVHNNSLLFPAHHRQGAGVFQFASTYEVTEYAARHVYVSHPFPTAAPVLQPVGYNSIAESLSNDQISHTIGAFTVFIILFVFLTLFYCWLSNSAKVWIGAESLTEEYEAQNEYYSQTTSVRGGQSVTSGSQRYTGRNSNDNNRSNHSLARVDSVISDGDFIGHVEDDGNDVRYRWQLT